MTTKREKKADYKFFFRCIINAVKLVSGEIYRPNCLVADAAGAITKGFMSAMGYNSVEEFKRVVCYQHVSRNIDKHIGSINKEARVQIKDDVLEMQASQSTAIFNTVSRLFLDKWSIQPEFCKYFKKVWLELSRSGWYQGFATAIPDHNNSNEADNRYIKEDQDRKRLGLIQFLNHACDNLVHGWSKRRAASSCHDEPFLISPVLELKDWANAWKWSSLDKKRKKARLKIKTFFFKYDKIF